MALFYLLSIFIFPGQGHPGIIRIRIYINVHQSVKRGEVLQTHMFFMSAFYIIYLLIFFITNGTHETDTIIREGRIDYLFGSPDLLVGDHFFRDLLHQFDVSTIVLDEFHTIASCRVFV